MPQRRTPNVPEARPRLTIARAEADQKLSGQIEKGEEIRKRVILTDDDFRIAKDNMRTWRDYCGELLRAMFTTDELKVEFSGSVFFIGGGAQTPQAQLRELHEDLGSYLRTLTSIKERLDLYDEPENHAKLIAQSDSALVQRVRSGEKVFVVHGRDEAAKEKVARFLVRLELEAVILHEQSNQGRTIIEKFEQEGDVGFAVVLLTPDDVGAPSNEATSLTPRPRQNVVFECGFFIGKLGRNRVCVLRDERVERPSDLEGVVYVPLDARDGWKIQLARDMKAVGLKVDLNKAL